jgi:hypothetical protein
MAFGEVKALYKYEFEPRDRAEVFGDDLIVYAYWIDNRFFCSASAWRVPKNMKWKDFVNHISSLYGLTRIIKMSRNGNGIILTKNSTRKMTKLLLSLV